MQILVFLPFSRPLFSSIGVFEMLRVSFQKKVGVFALDSHAVWILGRTTAPLSTTTRSRSIYCEPVKIAPELRWHKKVRLVERPGSAPKSVIFEHRFSKARINISREYSTGGSAGGARSLSVAFATCCSAAPFWSS